jgi:hypothetical protein
MTHEIAAANKELVRRFYKEVYVNWNMALADDVISPQFTSTIGRKTARPVRRHSGTIILPSGLHYPTPDMKSMI